MRYEELILADGTAVASSSVLTFSSNLDYVRVTCPSHLLVEQQASPHLSWR